MISFITSFFIIFPIVMIIYNISIVVIIITIDVTTIIDSILANDIDIITSYNIVIAITVVVITIIDNAIDVYFIIVILLLTFMFLT